jgi:hypothetical protein
VRSKAQSVRRLVAPKLADAELPDRPHSIQDEKVRDGKLSKMNKEDVNEDTASTCSAEESSATSRSDDEQECITDPDLLTRLLKDAQGEWVTKKGSSVKINGLVATWSNGMKGSLSADHEFLYLKFPQDEKEYHAHLRIEDNVLCWSDGDFWRRSENRDVPLPEEEWHGVLKPKKNESLISQEKVVIHGVVSVGHSSDTETESSADETPALGHKCGQRKMRTRRERTEKSSLTLQVKQEAPLDLLS